MFSMKISKHCLSCNSMNNNNYNFYFMLQFFAKLNPCDESFNFLNSRKFYFIILQKLFQSACCIPLTRLSGSLKLTFPTNAFTWLCSLMLEGDSMMLVGASLIFSKSIRNCRLISYPLPPTPSVQFTW